MNTSCHVAQLLEGDCDLMPRLIQPRSGLGARRKALFHEAQLQGERNQALLSAVVKVALEPLAFLLACIDHPCAGSPQLFEASSQLGLQACVLDGDSGRRSDCAEQLGLVLQRRVVQKCGHVFAVPFDQRRRSPSAKVLQIEGPTLDIDIGAEVGQPICEVECRIAECPSKSVAEIGRGEVHAELDDEVAERIWATQGPPYAADMNRDAIMTSPRPKASTSRESERRSGLPACNLRTASTATPVRQNTLTIVSWALSAVSATPGFTWCSSRLRGPKPPKYMRTSSPPMAVTYDVRTRLRTNDPRNRPSGNARKTWKKRTGGTRSSACPTV